MLCLFLPRDADSAWDRLRRFYLENSLHLVRSLVNTFFTTSSKILILHQLLHATPTLAQEQGFVHNVNEITDW